MAASDTTIANNARDSLNRILQTDASQMSEEGRNLRQLEIDRLTDLIERFEDRASRASGRRIVQPVTRVNV